MRLFPLEIVPIVCAHCGEEMNDDNTQNDDGTCTSCFVNTDCPAECNTPHDAPSFRQANGAEWECPGDGGVFYYMGPNRLADRARGEWQEYETVLVRERSGQRRYHWIDRDEAYWCEGCQDYILDSDYAGDDYCQSCHDEHDHYDCDCDECNGAAEVGPPVTVRCSRSCTLTATHYDPITEAVTCGRHATHSHELIPELIAA